MNSLKKISASELKTRVANEDIILLDVRQPDEWEASRIEGALNIPLPDLEERLSELNHLKGRELVVYCRTGNRSTQAWMFLELSGFANVINLTGGIEAYQA